MRLHSARSNRRTENGCDYLDMEIAVGSQKHVISIYPDSDPEALALEFVAQNNLPDDLVEQLTEEIINHYNASFPDE